MTLYALSSCPKWLQLATNIWGCFAAETKKAVMVIQIFLLFTDILAKQNIFWTNILFRLEAVTQTICRVNPEDRILALVELNTTCVWGSLDADSILQVTLVVTTICRIIIEAPDVTTEICVVLQTSIRGYNIAHQIQDITNFSTLNFS